MECPTRSAKIWSKQCGGTTLSKLAAEVQANRRARDTRMGLGTGLAQQRAGGLVGKEAGGVGRAGTEHARREAPPEAPPALGLVKLHHGVPRAPVVYVAAVG